MRKPVSGGMRHTLPIIHALEALEIKETGKE
jgi:hypothetical protein